MAVSKKIRFEVFKRDGFLCSYCGRTPPDVTLECDHIEPVSKGGGDQMTNLITACFDCNRGKTNIPLDKAPARLSENTEILREKEDQLKEYRKIIAKVERRIKRDIKKVDEIYSEAFEEWSLSGHFKGGTVRKFVNALPLDEILDAMRTACNTSRFDENSSIKYFCGICWNKIRGTEK